MSSSYSSDASSSSDLSEQVASKINPHVLAAAFKETQRPNLRLSRSDQEVEYNQLFDTPRAPNSSERPGSTSPVSLSSSRSNFAFGSFGVGYGPLDADALLMTHEVAPRSPQRFGNSGPSLISRHHSSPGHVSWSAHDWRSPAIPDGKLSLQTSLGAKSQDTAETQLQPSYAQSWVRLPPRPASEVEAQATLRYDLNSLSIDSSGVD